jgi:hypothetical protein
VESTAIILRQIAVLSCGWVGMFGTTIDIAINVIEKANMASLNDFKSSNLIFLDELLLS